MRSELASGYGSHPPSVDVLLSRLDGVGTSGAGWRARCACCGGRSRKLSIAMADDRVLLHCFGGCRAEDVLHAVGLTWADVMPPRYWLQTPEERRRARRAAREAGWSAALAVLAREANIVRMAARQLAEWNELSVDDEARLARAVELLDHATAVLVEAAPWRPGLQA